MNRTETNITEMELTERIELHFTCSIDAKRRALETTAPAIVRAAKAIVRCLRSGGKVLACGNGGSAADAQHFAAELLNRFEIERPPLAAIALTTDTSALTSIANDYHFEQVFSKQILALGKNEDILFAISTSGNSLNILQALEAAHAARMVTVILTGRDGGRTVELMQDGDIEIRVPSESTARIQEVHITLIHCICDLVDYLLLRGKNR